MTRLERDGVSMQVSDARKIWNSACDKYLVNEVSPLTYNTWFRKVEPFSPDDQTFVLAVPNDVTREYMVKYTDLITNVLVMLTNKNYDVRVKVYENGIADIEESLVTNKKNKSNANTERRHQGSTLNPQYTFDNFIVGSSNGFAHAACVAVATMQGSQNYNPLFLYGGSGLGKTHLLHAIGNQVLVEHPDRNVVYIQTEQFVNEFISCIQRNDYDDFRKSYRMTDMLLIDDIQFIEGKEQMQVEFFHTFNWLFESGKNIVLSCDKPPQSLATLEERLKTRFISGLTIDITPPDYETRVAILKNLADLSNMTLPSEVIHYIANSFTTNVRELEGAFKTIKASADIGHPISLETTKNLLKNMIHPGTVRPLDPLLIMEVVANYYSVTVGDLKSKLRSQDVVIPRHMAMYLCRTKLGMTNTEIGLLFGGKNHATVINACANIKSKLESDPRTQEQLDNIEERLV
ncbi:MAG TPA: chromosomal replication initiator protein DnaA [Clostridiaceae bacterium]|nr:chromosomal replication initiator protein DnaA [Clostridiaceae bacterium]